MRTRLISAAVCILALPVLISPFQGNKFTSTAPFATIALAGHTMLGGWCECGAPGCMCDPGEVGGSSRALPNQTEKPSNQNASPIREHTRSGFDFGTGALMLAIALFVWTRLRA